MIFYTFITNNIIKSKCELVLNFSIVLQHAKYLVLNLIKQVFCKLAARKILTFRVSLHGPWRTNYSRRVTCADVPRVSVHIKE